MKKIYIWTNEENALLRSLYKIYDYKSLQVFFPNKNKSAILNQIFKLHLIKTPNWSSNEIDFLKKNYGILTAREIGVYLNKSRSCVKAKARSLKLKSNIKALFTYKYYDDFFAIPSILNSYWAGFIAADGCIYKNELIVSLNIQDIDHLNTLRDLLKSNRPIKECHHNMREMRISSKKIVKDLEINFNIVPRKTHILQSPENLNEQCKLAYIIGYIDGDGSIYYQKNKYIYINVTGNKYIVSWIKNIFDTLSSKTYSGKGLASVYFYKKRMACSLKIGGRRAINIANILGVINVPRMNRKWDKIGVTNA